MIDLMLEDAGRTDDGLSIVIESLMKSALEEVRAALHELVDILESDLEEVRAEMHDGMPIASNTFPPAEVWQ